MIRCGASKLEDGLPALCGSGGTGGASGSGEAMFRWDGEGVRNVRSVIELLLPLRARPGRSLPATTLPLLFEEFDNLLTIRLVWTFPTGSGEVVCDRSAAAAAADDS